ncbi:MAG: hypothetical protein IRZ26_06955 [Clostridia bacterium]|nr:hypothetical protein [Clostridia bacterium]MCL6521956.1 hypothetical protein [Bacillota bacterium]
MGLNLSPADRLLLAMTLVQAAAALCAWFTSDRAGRWAVFAAQAVAAALAARLQPGGGLRPASALGPGAAWLAVILGVGLTVTAYRLWESPEARSEGDGHRYNALLALLLAVVAAVPFAGSGLRLWLSVEAVTFLMALLIDVERRPQSVEAAWKLYILSAAGSLVALLGTALAEGSAQPALALTLLAVGYGAKAGLVPLYLWKPDAYAATSATTGALLASLESLVGLYAIAWWVPRLGVSSAPSWPLLLLGGLSLLMAALALPAERDPRKALAYSTVEQAALAVLALAAGGPAGPLLAFWLTLNNAAAKPLAFFTLGRPGAARWLYALALLTLAGVPPMNVFFGELALFRTLGAFRPLLLAGVLALLVPIFIGLVRLVTVALFPAPQPESQAAGEASPLSWSAALASAVHLLAVLALGAAGLPLAVLGGAVLGAAGLGGGLL